MVAVPGAATPFVGPPAAWGTNTVVVTVKLAASGPDKSVPPLLIAVTPAFGLAAVSVVTPLTPDGTPAKTPAPLRTVVEVIAVLAL